MEVIERINAIDRETITSDMNDRGYALVPAVLPNEECVEFIAQYRNDTLYRKTVVMARHGYGLGEYKYFQYPLPVLIAQLREHIYPLLAPIANNWMRVLDIDKQFPESLTGLIELCHVNNQNRPTPLILRYEKGGYNALHQDLYGDVYFPMQLVLFLNEPGRDYEGGEFVLIEQKPRAQSKAIVLNPRKGDMLVFTTNFRPGRGSKGYYRANMKHGVSEISAGERHTLGIIFHDAS
jgi:hypothetical protein